MSPPDTHEAERARARGDLPRAPGYSAWLAVLGALGGLALAVPMVGRLAPELADAAFSHFDASRVWELLAPLAATIAGLPLLGALLGLVLAQVSLGAVDFRLRARIRPGPAPRPSVLLAVLALPAPALALFLLPHLEPAPDVGYAQLLAPIVALFCAAALLLPAALLQRARSVAAWRDRVAPEPPPRRDPDEPAPEMKAAMRTP